MTSFNRIGTRWTDCDTSETGDAVILRQSAKNVLYSFVNSNAMNSEVTGYKMASWRMAIYLADAVLAIGIVAWGMVVFIAKKPKNIK